jgi:hypothetical protein
MNLSTVCLTDKSDIMKIVDQLNKFPEKVRETESSEFKQLLENNVLVLHVVLFFLKN